MFELQDDWNNYLLNFFNCIFNWQYDLCKNFFIKPKDAYVVCSSYCGWTNMLFHFELELAIIGVDIWWKMSKAFNVTY